MKKTLIFCFIALLSIQPLFSVPASYTSTYFNKDKSVKTALSISIDRALLPRFSLLFGIDVGKCTQIGEINYLGDVYFVNALFEPRFYPKNSRLSGLFLGGTFQAGLSQIPYTSSNSIISVINYSFQYGVKIGYVYTPMAIEIFGKASRIGIEPSLSFSGITFIDDNAMIKNTFRIIAGLNMLFDFPHYYTAHKTIHKTSLITNMQSSDKTNTLSNSISTNTISTNTNNEITN